jgi:hypothetical protein
MIALLGFLIGVTKGGFNGMGSLLTPLLSLILPVSSAVGVLLPMLIVGDACALYTYRGEWDSKLVWRMLPAGLAGALAGTYLLTALSPNALRIALAIFVFVVVGYWWTSERIQGWRYRPQAWHGPVVGAVAGLASGMFNSGGPAFNSYLLLQALPPRAFIATTALFFALLNWLKMPGFVYTGVLDPSLLLSVWWVFLFIPVGILAARWLVTRIRAVVFERVIVGLLVCSSVLLIVQSR